MDAEADSQILAPTLVSDLEQTDGTDTTKTGAPADQYKLYEDTFAASNTRAYRLRMWIDQNYSSLGTSGTYKLRVNVYGAAAA